MPLEFVKRISVAAAILILSPDTAIPLPAVNAPVTVATPAILTLSKFV